MNTHDQNGRNEDMNTHTREEVNNTMNANTNGPRSAAMSDQRTSGANMTRSP